MARRMIVRTKIGDEMNWHRPLIEQIEGGIFGSLEPVYGPPVFTIDGDFDVELVDLRNYVQVEFVGSARVLGPETHIPGKLYTYIDPDLDLEIGDLVDVPTKFEDHNLAVVRKLGADDVWLAGLIVKEVLARFVKIEAEGAVDRAVNEAGSVSCGPEYGCFCNEPEGVCECRW